jgi:hypothetical protein
MPQSTPLFVGLDVHKDSIAVAHAAGGSTEPPVFVGAIGPRQADRDQLLRRLQGKAAALRFAYEAGPSGYGLYRYRGRRSTDHSTVVPNPRISAGSTVGVTGPAPALPRGHTRAGSVPPIAPTTRPPARTAAGWAVCSAAWTAPAPSRQRGRASDPPTTRHVCLGRHWLDRTKSYQRSK